MSSSISQSNFPGTFRFSKLNKSKWISTPLFKNDINSELELGLQIKELINMGVFKNNVDKKFGYYAFSSVKNSHVDVEVWKKCGMNSISKFYIDLEYDEPTTINVFFIIFSMIIKSCGSEILGLLFTRQVICVMVNTSNHDNEKSFIRDICSTFINCLNNVVCITKCSLVIDDKKMKKMLKYNAYLDEAKNTMNCKIDNNKKTDRVRHNERKVRVISQLR